MLNNSNPVLRARLRRSRSADRRLMLSLSPKNRSDLDPNAWYVLWGTSAEAVVTASNGDEAARAVLPPDAKLEPKQDVAAGEIAYWVIHNGARTVVWLKKIADRIAMYSADRQNEVRLHLRFLANSGNSIPLNY